MQHCVDQSFNDDDLKLLNRRHNSETAINAIELSRKVGFSNISFDLMFNLPNMTLEKWEKNLEKAVELQTEHISCYSLTREEGTMLDKLVNKKIISLILVFSFLFSFVTSISRQKSAKISKSTFPSMYIEIISSNW